MVGVILAMHYTSQHHTISRFNKFFKLYRWELLKFFARLVTRLQCG